MTRSHGRHVLRSRDRSRPEWRPAPRPPPFKPDDLRDQRRDSDQRKQKGQSVKFVDEVEEPSPDDPYASNVHAGLRCSSRFGRNP